MKIGKYIIRSAKQIKSLTNTIIKKSDYNNDEVNLIRLKQIYECRILGLCFYRDEHSWDKTFNTPNVTNTL